MTANNLQHIDALPELPDLEELYLAQNRLLSLPPLSIKAESLEILDVRENLFPDIENLFAVIRSMDNLVEFSVTEAIIPHNRNDE